MPRRLMQGNAACVAGALAAGVRFFAGYPITPATEIAELMALKLPRLGGAFVQFEDELASIAAVVGASLAGVKAMTATSGPGFTLMQENLGYAAIIEAPCVVVNVMRGGPSTGLPTLPAQGDVMQARWGTHGDHPAVVLAPATVRDYFDFTVRAVNLAEELRTPVTILADASIAHLHEVVDLPDQVLVAARPAPAVPPADYKPHAVTGQSLVPGMANLGQGYHFHLTSNTHDAAGYPDYSPAAAHSLTTRLLAKVARRRDIVITRPFHLDDAAVAVVAFGSVARAARQAVLDAREQGLKAGLLELCTLWPFPEAAVRDLAGRVRGIVVAEMNAGQVIIDVKAAAHGKRAEVFALNQYNGKLIAPQTILNRLREVG